MSINLALQNLTDFSKYVDCPAGCDNGVVNGDERCGTCNGKGWVEEED